jgi:hypothetical protein
MSETELEALVAKLVAEELERRAKPPAPFKSDYVRPDPTANATMPASARAEMVRVMAGGDLMREIVKDNRASVTDFRPQGPDTAPKARGNGWRDATPLSNPPGTSQADKLMDAADEADRIELAQRLAREVVARRAGEK